MATYRICSIPDCGKNIKARGWCSSHYQRWHRLGDPVAGGPAKGTPLKFMREIVLNYEGDKCLLWPFSTITSGYANVWIGSKSFLVSRLACEEANGPPPTPEHHAAHSCGNGHLACVTKKHLSWKTPLENEADKFVHGPRIGRPINIYFSG